MLALDLFNTKYERELLEGGVDNLEARRIDLLNDRMQELLARAREDDYKNNPAALSALKKQFQQFKDERDSYFKVREGSVTPTATGLRHHARPDTYGGYEPEADPLAKLDKQGVNRADRALGIKFDREKKYQGGLDVDEAGIPGSVPTEKIPGKEDLLKGRGRSYYEATGDGKFDSMMGKISKDPWTRLNADPNWEYEIEELVDRNIEPWLLTMEKSGMPITRDEDTLNPGWRKRYEQVANQLAQKYLISKGMNPRDPDLVGKIRYAIDSHTDQSKNVHGQLSAYSDLPLARYQNDFDADGMTANMRDRMVGFISTDDDDDDEPPTRPMPDNDPRRLDPGNIEEGDDWMTRNRRFQDQATQDRLDHEEEMQAREFDRGQRRRERMAGSSAAGVDLGRWLKPYQMLEKNNFEPIETKDRFEYLMQVALKLKGTGAGFDGWTGMSTAARLFKLDPGEQKLVANLIRNSPRIKDLETYMRDSLAEDAVDEKSWMTQTRAKYPTAKFMQAKMPGAPIRAYVKGKVVAEFSTDQKKNPALGEKKLGQLRPTLGTGHDIGRSVRKFRAQRGLDEQGMAEGALDSLHADLADVYNRLAPKIEHHKDSFLAGQLYDALEAVAEKNGAESEFKRMMNSARNRAHMEYDTNPGGFHNWFWFLPFEDDAMTESTDTIKKQMSKLEALALAANRAGNDDKCKMYQQKIQSLKQKLSQSMTEDQDKDVAEMDKSQPSQERHGDRALGAKGTTAKPVTAQKVVKDLAMDFDQAFAKQKPVKKKGVKEGKITLSTDPNWYGAEVSDYKATGPIVNLSASQLVGFEPDNKMNQPASKANVEKIVAGLKQGAKLPPLLVRKYKNGYQVLDGHHRFLAYKLLGTKSIPAQVVPDEDIEEKGQQGVAEGHADQQRKIFKKNGKPVGEVGIDRESSPGVGQYYMKHYASGKDLAGYDSYEEAVAELKHFMKQGVAEGFTDTLKFAWRELKTNVVDFVANAVGLPNDQRREVFVRAGNEFSNEVIELLANHPARDKLIPMVREIGGYMAKARTLEELKLLLDKAGLFLADVDAGKFNPSSGVAKPLPGYRDNQGVAEGWSDAMLSRRTGQPRTPYSVYIKGKKWKDFADDDHAQAVANKLRAKFKADGRDPETITITPTDYDQPIKENQDSSGVESAIIRRIMVSHTDLLRKFGPNKVMQAAEEVAYNVGDVDEIGTSDVSAYVNQVRQILGAV